ncbi:MAG: hypothetical protein KAV87_26415 [Desulfobacteraceae bacterium]|nr:hypothetical protein [Desulfobacteraceae bacterium]
MSENLYFISIIARALHEPDIEKALKEAFRKIKRMRTEERYAEGFSNFELFMDSAYRHHKITATDYAHELIAQLVTGTFEGSTQEKRSLLDFITSHPEWKTEYEAIRRMEEDENLMQEFPVIEVSSDKGIVIEKTFKKVPGCESFDGILPGNYKIRLVNTGWVIWEGELTAKELMWSEAHKGKNLPLAAGKRRPTDEIDLLNNGEVILRTYAGIESGCIEIELTR